MMATDNLDYVYLGWPRGKTRIGDVEVYQVYTKIIDELEPKEFK